MGNPISENCMGPRVKVFRSTDHGLSWELVSALPDYPGQKQTDWHEVDTVQADNGMIITQIRNESTRTCFKDVETWQTESVDGGRTWGSYHKVADGHTTDLFRLADGRIIMSYNWRIKPLGLRCRVGLDLPGSFWSDEFTLCDDGETWDIGYPSTAQLPDGTLVTLWYQFRKSAGVASLRWLKWQLDPL